VYGLKAAMSRHFSGLKPSGPIVVNMVSWSRVYIRNSVNFNLGGLAGRVVVLFNNGGKHVKTVEAVEVQLSLQDVRAVHADTPSGGSETAYRLDTRRPCQRAGRLPPSCSLALSAP